MMTIGGIVEDIEAKKIICPEPIIISNYFINREKYLLIEANGWIIQLDGQMFGNSFSNVQEILHKIFFRLFLN